MCSSRVTFKSPINNKKVQTKLTMFMKKATPPTTLSTAPTDDDDADDPWASTSDASSQ